MIEESCAGDESLRREVESLLAHHKNARKFIETPALESPDAGKSDISEQAPVALQAGMRLGDYEIQKLLGSGGVGEVYRARDTRLGRDVAIKVLPSYLSGDVDRLRRFEQKAKAAEPSLVVSRFNPYCKLIATFVSWLRDPVVPLMVTRMVPVNTSFTPVAVCEGRLFVSPLYCAVMLYVPTGGQLAGNGPCPRFTV